MPLQPLAITQVFIESIKQGEIRPIKLSKNAMLIASLLHKDLAVLRKESSRYYLETNRTEG
jgi:hypothetical protein